MTTPMRTPDLLARLRRHYLPPGPMPGGVFAHEVAWNGGRGTGRCDAIYAGFTSASGRILIGHEIKVTRADWQHELAQPHKADPWADSCHAWYVVAPSTDVVKPEEVPHGWGLLVVNPRTTTRLTCAVKPATRTLPWEPPWEAVRSFLARLDTLARDEAHGARAKMRDEVRKEYEKQVEARVAADLARRGDSEIPKKRLDALEKALGIRVTDRGAFVYRDDEVTIETLRQIGELLQAGQSLATVAAHLSRPYGDVLANAERELTALRASIDALTAVAGKEST